jgi:hypothetical protein
MGELIRQFDWKKTTLGEPAGWPLSLQTTVGIILHSAFPMFLFWGRELLCFYNDAYRPSLGKDGKHPLIGKSAKEAWPDIWDFIGPLIEKVMATGEAVWFEDQLLPIYRNGKMEDVYWTFSYSPSYGDDGSVQGVFVTCTETTNKILAAQKLENSQVELLNSFEQSPVAIATISKDKLTFRLVNRFYAELVGRTPGELKDKPMLEALPELAGQGFDTLLEEVIETGVPFLSPVVPVKLDRKGVSETVYMDLAYHPQYDLQGNIMGVLVVATDVSKQVSAQKELAESKERLVFAIDAAELGTWDLDPVTNKFNGNDRLKAWFGLPPGSEIELSRATDVIIEEDRPRVLNAIERALSNENGGRYEVEYTIRNPNTGKLTIVKAKGQAHFDDRGVPFTFNGTLQDVTEESTVKKQLAREVIEQRAAQRQLEESELFSRNIFYNSPVAKLVLKGSEMKIDRVNENMLTMLGRDHSVVGQLFFEALPELKNTALPGRLSHVFLTGETFVQPEEKLEFFRYGISHSGFYNYTYKALSSTSGEIYGVMVTAVEVTQQVIARKQVEEKEKELRDLITAAPIGICVVSGNSIKAEDVNDRFELISGKSRAQLLTQPFWKVLHEIAPVFEPILANVFESGETFSSNEHEIVLLRGGKEEKIFATFQYVPVIDAAGSVIKVIMLAVEVTHQVEMRKKIEEAVVKRTLELAESNRSLQRSNKELEQFAYIASHDLQEPIRKISTFTQLLEFSIKDMSEKSKDYVTKIYNSTERMSTLIRDVLAYSRVNDESDEFEKVDLNKIIETVKTDFELQIEQTKATIEIADLPTIDAIPTQMIQLFNNLMSNSLKYRRPGVSPVIQISCSVAKEEKVAKRMALNPAKKYFHLEFRDNGIGFHEDYVDRIFKIFQRLHGKTEFEGTGIGLAIVLKIIQKHQGHISAMVGENGGAIFNILLPEVVDLVPQVDQPA